VRGNDQTLDEFGNQLELLFAHYLNSGSKNHEARAELVRLSEEIKQLLQRPLQPLAASSRYPGRSLMHKLITKLTARQMEAQRTEARLCLENLNRQISLLILLWREQYESEFLLERRARLALEDRLSMVQSHNARLALLEVKIHELRPEDK
jgi:hypothetical protein